MFRERTYMKLYQSYTKPFVTPVTLNFGTFKLNYALESYLKLIIRIGEILKRKLLRKLFHKLL